MDGFCSGYACGSDLPQLISCTEVNTPRKLKFDIDLPLGENEGKAFSSAIRQLEKLKICHCDSLASLHSTVTSLPNLGELSWARYWRGQECRSAIAHLITISPKLQMVEFIDQLDDQILKAMADGWPNLRAFRFVDCLDSVSCTGWRYFIDHISLLDSFSVPARISESQFAYLCDRHGATLKVVDIQDELAKDWMPRKLISSAPIISVLRISLSSDVCSELKYLRHLETLVLSVEGETTNQKVPDLFRSGSYLSGLRCLSICFCDSVTDEIVDIIATYCPSLTALAFDEGMISSAGVQMIIDRCSNLMSLKFSYEGDFSEEMLAAIPSTKLQKLRFLCVCGITFEGNAIRSLLRRKSDLIVHLGGSHSRLLTSKQGGEITSTLTGRLPVQLATELFEEIGVHPWVSNNFHFVK